METLVREAVTTQGVVITKNSKSEDLREMFKSQIESGAVFTYAIEQPKDEKGLPKKDKQGKEYLVAFMVQSRKLRDDATDDLNALLLGWNNERLVRTLHRIDKDLWDKSLNKIFGIGVLQHNIEALKGKSTNIQVQHLEEPAYEGQQARQIQGQYLISASGKFTYEHTELVIGEPKDLIIDSIRVDIEGFTDPSGEGEIL